MTDRDKPAPCYRDRHNGVYFTKHAHRHDCTDVDCRGCTPCPERHHCTARRGCTWHVTPQRPTCGRCVAVVRQDITWITDLAALTLTAAIADGLDSPAANLAGPATDAEAWTWRKIAAKQGRAWHVSLIEDDDEHHPGRVLGTWARMIAEDYGHDMPFAATITWCAGYLDRQLHRIAQDPEQDFDLMRRELRKCRQHLEAVLHNDTKPDQGAPCPTCRDAGRIVRLTRQYAHWCQDDECERLHFTDETSDVWRCPHDRDHWWTQSGYADLLRERRVTA